MLGVPKPQGGPCEFPDPEKKSSQTKQLWVPPFSSTRAEDVAAFNGRLGTIEQSLTHLTKLVSRSVQDSCGRSRSLRSSPEAVNGLTDSDLEDELSSGQSTPDSSRTGIRSPSIIVNDGPMERFYGALSTYSLLIRSRNLVERLLNPDRQQSPKQGLTRVNSMRSSPASPSSINGSPSVFAELRRKYDSFSGTSKFKEHFEVGDDRPLELPPRQELEDAIDIFLSEHTLEPPIFQKKTVMNAVSEQYDASRSKVDESWILCFSAIILRSSALISRSFRANTFATPSVDDKVLSLLFANANTALRQMERFCALRMVNVQALLLLALVARDSIHFNVFERIFDRVCQLAKHMGLHERGTVGDDPTPEDLERQNVLWVLYSIDKQRVFIRGPPCRIYLFECHIQLPRGGDFKQQLISASLRLTCVVEGIYRHLYCPKANSQDLKPRQNRVNQLSSRLASWARQFENILVSAQTGGNLEMALGLQLRYAFHVAQLLVHSKSLDGQGNQFRLDTARNALEIIQKLSSESFGFNGYVSVLERIFCSYSVIAFHEVFDNMLSMTNTVGTDDLSLLVNATNALRLLSCPNRPYSYCTRLYKNFSWCTEIAMLVQKSQKLASTDTGRANVIGFDNSTPSVFETFDFLQKDPSAQLPPTRQRLTQDFEGDFRMKEGSQVSGAIPNSSTVDSLPANLNPSDSSSFQNALNNDIFNFNNFDPTADNLANLFTTSAEMPIEYSSQFQDALQWAFEKGNGLDSSFQQVMNGQGMPAIPIINQ
ncbi:MAG: hypothetical protein LQ342_006535 [Letrouitia transgressa]|nr:MAG: hypothetical protein LQ342_006535 [Letrouitia transgressa]